MVIANPNIWPSVDQRHLPATYKYDAFGRRIEKVDSKASKTRRYYYDDRQRVLEEYDNAGTPARQAYFVWGTYVDELLLVNDDADDDADYYACRDHLYSVHVLYNPTTGIAERYDYDAYGQPTIYTADGGDSDWWDGDETTANDSTIENVYTFTGRRLDVLDSGDFTIMYYRARYYSPNTGRFISRDPLEYEDGMNLYQAVQSQPTKMTDSTGLKSCTWNGSIRGSFTGTIIGGYGTISVNATGVDEDGCAYSVSGSGSNWIAGAMFGIGYFSASAEIVDEPAPCMWPLGQGSFAVITIVGYGVPIPGVPGLSGLAWVHAEAGCLKADDGPFDVGGFNLFVAGGGFTVNLDEDVIRVGPSPRDQ